MEAKGKQRIAKWLNIFLLIINLSALATILFMNGAAPEEVQSDRFSSDEFLRQQLNLTEEQFREISELDAKIFRVYQSLIDMQCEQQFKMLNELLEDNPSKEKLDSLALSIGRLQTGIKRQTIKHFMNIKSIVDEDQEELLDQILVEMMEMNKQCKFCNKTDCDRRNQISGKK